jgi:hypothetical protein
MAFGKRKPFKKGFKKTFKRFRKMKQTFKRSVYHYKRSVVVICPLNEGALVSHLDAITGKVSWNHANFGTTDQAIDNFNLTNVPGYTDFTNLYDEYKITGVKTTFSFSNNSSDMTNLNATGIPEIYTACDWDDGVPVTAISDLTQYQSFKHRRLDKDVSVFTRPRAQCMLYEGLASTAYGTYYGWVDCNDDMTPHYGLKYIIQSAASSNSERTIGTLTIVHTFYIKCRGAR